MLHAPLTVITLTNPQSLLEMEADWRALERDDAPYQSFDWCAPIISDNPQGARFFALAAFGQDELQALLPLALFAKGRRIILTGLGEPMQLNTEVLLRDTALAQAAMAAFLPVLQGCGADYVHLGQVKDGGPLASACQRDFLKSSPQDGATDYLLPLTFKGKLYCHLWARGIGRILSRLRPS